VEIRGSNPLGGTSLARAPLAVRERVDAGGRRIRRDVFPGRLAAPERLEPGAAGFPHIPSPHRALPGPPRGGPFAATSGHMVPRQSFSAYGKPRPGGRRLPQVAVGGHHGSFFDPVGGAASGATLTPRAAVVVALDAAPEVRPPRIQVPQAQQIRPRST
jgi:hypothetical protein